MAHAEHMTAHAQLMSTSNNLPPPPDAFDPNAMYRVRLNRTVEVADGHVLRPSQDVVVSGAYAETIRDAIVGAQVVPEPMNVPL